MACDHRSQKGRRFAYGYFAAIVCIATVILFSTFIAWASWAGEMESPDLRMRCGTFALPREPLLPGKDVASLTETRLSKPAEDFEVGDTLTLWAYDFSGSWYQVEVTCRRIGGVSYVFVEDSQWGTRVTEEDLQVLLDAFEHSTPAYPDKGIYDLDVEMFGAPSDIDHNGAILIVVLDIQDGGSGAYAGYVNRDELRETSYGHSNLREIVYIDCDPLDIKSRLAQETLAHEFQHLIHIAYDAFEEPWLDEGCSTYAEQVCGYGGELGARFLPQPDNGLTRWTGTLADYDKVGLFVTYLSEHYGGARFIRSLVSVKGKRDGSTVPIPLQGITSVDTALAQSGSTARFEEVFADWTVANYLDAVATLPGKYGYAQHDLSRIRVKAVSELPFSGWNEQVDLWAADYLEFTGGEGLEIFFNGDRRSIFRLQAVQTSWDPISVEDLPLDEGHWGHFIVSPGDTIALIVSRTAGDYGGYSIEVENGPALVAEGASFRYVPAGPLLGQSFPNPFNTLVHIPLYLSFDKNGSEKASLQVFDERGRLVRRLGHFVEGSVGSGARVVTWDGRDDLGREVASGVYVVRLKVGSMVESRRAVLLR